MIESAYWKTELFKAADAIEEHCFVARWTEKRAVLLEREIMIALFCVRTLIERFKVSAKLAEKAVSVVSCSKKVNGPVTILNRHEVGDLYDMQRETRKTISLRFLCNQVIHSYIIFCARDETKRFSHIFVCSDFERNRFLYVLSIESIVALLREVAFDFPNRMRLEFDPKIQDYRVSQDTVSDTSV
jgi:hypothetical protein